MNFRILGLATALPPYTMRQSDSAIASAAYCCEDDRQARLLAGVYRRSEIETRGSVVLEEPNGSAIRQSFFAPLSQPADRGPTTSERMQRYAAEAPRLAISASELAMNAAGTDAQRIENLVTVSCTGFTAPGVDFALIENLGLQPTVARTHVGFMGCHGAINGLRVAHALANVRPGAPVLLTAVELCSLHFQYGWDLERVKANALFADGAAAVVGVAEAEAPGQTWSVAATGSCRLPDSADAMSWSIDDHGFVMTLSAGVPDLIRTHVRPWLESWLGAWGRKIEDIRSWAIHPGGPRILSSVAETLAIPDSAIGASREVLARFGNMSSPTVLFILDLLMRRQAERPCVAMAFGPGLVAEAALLV